MLTKRLAEFACDTERAPTAVLAAVCAALLDTLGVALAGSREAAAVIAFDYVNEIGARPQATVWGRQYATSIADAAFVNAIAAHALDFDDTQASLRGHPSSPMVPVALAVGEAAGSSGHEMLTAYAIGLEVAGKLGNAFGNAHYLRGWHSTATIGVFSATAVACRMWGMNAADLARAWGIAAAQAGGLVRNFGTMTKPFQVGHAARSALMAASLARRGFTADQQIFDNDNGFLSTYAADGESLHKVLDRLGNPWEALQPGINFKRWPCCYCNHRPIGGVLELMQEHAIRPDEVERVRIGFPPGSDEPLIYDSPETGLEGKFSIQYAIAATLLDGNPGFESFTDASVNRPRAREMMLKVERYRVPDAKIYSGTVGYNDVEIVTKRGVFSRRIDKGPGSPAWPMSEADQADKFVDCAQRVLSQAQARELFDLATRCEELPDVRLLAAATKPGRGLEAHRKIEIAPTSLAFK